MMMMMMIANTDHCHTQRRRVWLKSREDRKLQLFGRQPQISDSKIIPRTFTLNSHNARVEKIT